MKGRKAMNLLTLSTVFVLIKSTAPRNMKSCTGECENKFTTLESFSTNMLSVLTAYYGYCRLEQHFRSKGPVIDSQLHHMLSVLTAYYGRCRLEQHFRSKGPVIDSQLHHFKNCIFINDSENGELYGNTNVMQLKNCIDEYENKFTRKQYSLVFGWHFVCEDLPCNKLTTHAYGKYPPVLFPCGLVARVSGYRSRSPGSIPGATIFSAK
jgi:hypothetical protein